MPRLPKSIEKAVKLRRRLSEVEFLISKSLEEIAIGFYKVGKGFKGIKKEKLYLGGYTSFKEFCEERGGRYNLTLTAINKWMRCSGQVDKVLRENNAELLPIAEPLCRSFFSFQTEKDILSIWEQGLSTVEDNPFPTMIDKLRLATSKDKSRYKYELRDIVAIVDLDPAKNGHWAIITGVDQEWIEITDYQSTERVKIASKQVRPLYIAIDERPFYVELQSRLRRIDQKIPSEDEFSKSIIKMIGKDPKGSLTEIEEKTLKTIEEKYG